jgi:hypothetical protein
LSHKVESDALGGATTLAARRRAADEAVRALDGEVPDD